MSENNQIEYKPAVVSHPRDTMKELYLEQNPDGSFNDPRFAPPDLLLYLMSDEDPMTESVAEALEILLGASKQFWLNRDRDYQEYLRTR